MALSLPYPNTPLVGQPGDPVPINANFTALAQAIQSFDGSQIAAGTIVSSALSSTVNPITRDNLIITNFVSSGCIWITVSGLNGTMSSGTLFINGNMVLVNGVISNTFTASKDTYIDIDVNGNVYYQTVSNGTAAPSITANSIRVAKIITNGSAITSILQTGLDSLNNFIYPQNFVKSAADTNGWVARHYPGWITYEQTITVTGQVVGPNTNVALTGISIPIGIIDSSKLRFSIGLLGGFAGRIYVSLDNGNTNAAVTSMTPNLGNLTSGSITFTGFVYVYAITV